MSSLDNNLLVMDGKETELTEQDEIFFRQLQHTIPDDSPCESPIEDDFKHSIQKYLSGNAILQGQVWANTGIGNFRIDFVVEIVGRKVGFECDGKEFHDRQTDITRDDELIKGKHLNVIYHLRGTDIFQHIHECFKIIGAFEPALFSERGHVCIQSLCDRTEKHEYVTSENLVWKWLEQFYDNPDEPIDPKRVIISLTGRPSQRFYVKDYLEKPAFENRPRLQPWVSVRPNSQVPQGRKNRSVVPRGTFQFRVALYPALKGWAIVTSALRVSREKQALRLCVFAFNSPSCAF